MGNRIYGCDDCLAACPWNKFARASHEAQFLPRGEVAPTLGELAALDDAAFRVRFAGSPIKRIGRDRLARNVAIALGNSGDPALRPAAGHLAGDADAVVARRGAGRLSGWRDRGRARPAVWRPGQRHLPRLGAASLRAR
jgi:epoxyqueuosine reductase